MGSQLAASNQCIYNPKGCSDINLCAVAVRNISSEYVWEKVDKYLPYVKEARKRGLNCPSIRQSRGKSKPIVKVDELRSLFISQTEQNRRKLQQTLSSLGYYKSSIDGLYGKGTAAALKSYNREYLNNAPLSESANVEALLNEILKAKTSHRETDPKIQITLDFEEGELKVELGSGETSQVEEPVTPPLLNFAQVRASYDAGNFSQAFKDAQILSVDGNPDAQLYLGKMYADGRGTLQVTTYAHMWFNISSMNGSDEAYEARKALQTKMTPDLINEAQKMALTCIKSDYKECGLLVQPFESKSTNESNSTTDQSKPTSSELRSYFINQSTLQRKQMQYALKKLGYYKSSVDGLWGKGTLAAISQYTSNQNITDLSILYSRLTEEVKVPTKFSSAKPNISPKLVSGCKLSKSVCSDTALLCKFATKNGKWKTKINFQKYVSEAKRQGLNCNVTKQTSNLSRKKNSNNDGLLGILLLGLGAAAAANGEADAFIEGFANGMSGASSGSSQSTSSGSSSYSGSSSCSSDFSCGSGKKCVKKPGQATGVCMTSTNSYGVKTYSSPSTSSILPNNNGGGCRYNTDCPVGFRCDISYRACVK
ncbi:peptidoglycan-binding protein [Paracoccaceae bacterium]|nr:peptidoglycan-binding protein [Paracoccaceae bacterium]